MANARRRSRRDLLKSGAALAASLSVPGSVGRAWAQDAYPSRAIDILYGFGAGSSGDLTCRLMAGYLRKKWNVAINVLNKPGGNTVPACLELYNAAPDGYTMLGDPPGSSSLLAAAVKDLPFKVRDRTFVAMIGTSPMLLVVAPNSPFKSMTDIANALRKDPEQFRWTSQGAATGDLLFRKFLKSVGVDIARTRPVVVRSAPEIATLAAGGQVDLGILVIAAALPVIQGGLVRPISIVVDRRSPSLPNVETAAEQGFPGISTPTFIGISGPPKLPAPIIEKWNVALREMVQDPEMIAQFNKIGSTAFYRGSREFEKYVLEEAALVETLFS